MNRAFLAAASPATVPRTPLRQAAALLMIALLASCTSLGAAGPSRSSVLNRTDAAEAAIEIVELTDSTAQRLATYRQSRSFAEVFGNPLPVGTTFGRGDTVEIAIWEAPPAVLFGAGSLDSRLPSGSSQNSTNIPLQMVSDDGTVTVPFVGAVNLAGRTAAEVEREIVRRLVGRAHDPQVVVRLVSNFARNVTVIGEVRESRRVPLSASGERLLEAIAAAGGLSHPVDKSTVQLTRGSIVSIMPLDAVIADPAQNVRLLPEDVVTVLHQPFSFVAMGAVNRTAEVEFEGGGITLAQALGRVGGLRDDRADIRGVFIFRMEAPEALAPEVAATARRTADGRIPVIYRLDLGQPLSFFVAQDFAVRDDDVLYVTTAPLSDLQRFLGVISNVAFSTISIGNAVN